MQKKDGLGFISFEKAFSSGLKGRRKTYLTILKRVWSANFKMVWYVPELFGRPSPSPRTSLKSADSDFENTSDSDSACLFVYAFIL
jgi:hypothetical protein